MVGSRGSVELAVLDSHQSAPFLRRCGLSPLNQEGGGHAQGCHDSAWRWGETWTAIGDAPFPCPLTHPHRDKSSGNRRRRSRDSAVQVLAGARAFQCHSVFGRIAPVRGSQANTKLPRRRVSARHVATTNRSPTRPIAHAGAPERIVPFRPAGYSALAGVWVCFGFMLRSRRCQRHRG